mgnify:FL=1
MTGLPPGRRVHQSSTPSGNLTSRTQSSVPSAESYGTLPAEASPLVSRETSPSPEKQLPCRPRQSGSARCLTQTAVLLQQTSLDLSRPKRMYLPRSSAAAIGRIRQARRNLREAATGHWEAASRCSSCATAYALPASEEGEGITSHQQLEITASALGDVCRVSRSIAVGRFTIGFT